MVQRSISTEGTLKVREMPEQQERKSLETDTIAAISTPIGEGGIAVVRVSGPKALELADRCFRPGRKNAPRPSEAPTFTLHYGWIVRDGKPVDEVLLAVMRAPHTYTREDMVEVSCHGGYLPARMVLETFLAAGARLAEPGEFTKRAFLNGRLDLTQAEAVLDVIRARTDLALAAAERMLAGGLSERIQSMRERLIEVLAHIEAAIDFPEEGIEPETGQQLVRRMEEAIQEMDRLLATAREGRLLRQGARVVLIGRPNAGKSSLLNRLLSQDRAIVSPIPGTTRDTIEEAVNIGGIPVVLVDTAGLRHSEDPLEQEGMRRTYAAVEQADLIIHVIDRSEPAAEEDREALRRLASRRVIVALNKSDLPKRFEFLEPPSGEVVEISCLTGEGLDRLREVLRQQLLERPQQLNPEEPMINARHEEALRRAKAALEQALEGP